jgi:isoamylase
VRGLTVRHPAIPEQQRGTYAGLAHPAMVEYLTGLGITAVELMPVHQFIHYAFLEERGLRNYWGYSSIAYLAPHNEYAADGSDGGQVRAFKTMVKALHRAGHRGDPRRRLQPHQPKAITWGRCCRFKGIDNAAYYRTLNPEDPRHYMDYYRHRQQPPHAPSRMSCR